MRSWPSRTGESFARASEEPYRRRVTDAIRVGFAVVGVTVLSIHSAHNSQLAIAVFHSLNSLPNSLEPMFRFLYRLCALWAVALVVGAAVTAKRWRLARDLALAGFLAWLIARGLGLTLADGFSDGINATVRASHGPAFPNVPMALLTAVVAAASPYLTRRVRWLGDFLILVLIPTEMYLGVALPKALACSIILGWGIAAAVHYSFGSPGGRPTTGQVESALHDLGLPSAKNVRLAPIQPSEHTVMLAENGSGQLVIKVLGRDERDARLATKFWKFLYVKDSGPMLFLTRLQEVEHQAYLTLLAGSGGVRVPPVVVAGIGGPGTALLAEPDLGGRVLAEMDADEITDAMLADVWAQVARLHQVGICHGRLNTAQIVITDQGAAIVGFAYASAAAAPDQRAGDTAELLATTAAQVGVDRAVRAAVAGVGREAVIDALPLLQPAALSVGGRRTVAEHRREASAKLKELRESAAAATGTKVPELEQIGRVSGTTLVMILGTLLGIVALMSFIGDPETLVTTLKSAKPGAVILAYLICVSTAVGFALAFAGSIRKRLPAWPNVKLQSAGAFANLAIPLGSSALQIQFLRKEGVDNGSAVGAGLVTLVVGTATQIGMFFVAAAAAPSKVDVGTIPPGAIAWIVVLCTIGILIASAVVWFVPKLHKKLLPPIVSGWGSIYAVLKSPRQLSLLVGGSVLAYTLYSVALDLALYSVGAGQSVWAMIAINVGVSLVVGLVPVPGAGAAVSSFGLTGALIAYGVPQTAALSAVLIHTLNSKYLTAIPGWFAMHNLLGKDEL